MFFFGPYVCLWPSSMLYCEALEEMALLLSAQRTEAEAEVTGGQLTSVLSEGDADLVLRCQKQAQEKMMQDILKKEGAQNDVETLIEENLALKQKVPCGSIWMHMCM